MGCGHGTSANISSVPEISRLRGIYEKERRLFYYLEIVACFYTTRISRIHYYVMVNICNLAPLDGGQGVCSGLAPSVWLGAGPWRVSPLPPQDGPWRPRCVTGLSPLPRSPPSSRVFRRGRVSRCVPGPLSRAGRQEGADCFPSDHLVSLPDEAASRGYSSFGLCFLKQTRLEASDVACPPRLSGLQGTGLLLGVWPCRLGLQGQSQRSSAGGMAGGGGIADRAEPAGPTPGPDPWAGPGPRPAASLTWGGKGCPSHALWLTLLESAPEAGGPQSSAHTRLLLLRAGLDCFSFC